MNAKNRIVEALEEGAEVLDPAESDARFVAPEARIEPAGAARPRNTRHRAPKSAEARPTFKELGREHRGY